MSKSRTKQLQEVTTLLMLHMVMLEAVLVTLAALVPDEELDQLQAALDVTAETPAFRRPERAMLSAIADELMTQIMRRREEMREE